MAKNILKNKKVVIFAAIWVLIMLVFLGRQMYQKYLIQKEIESLQGEITSLESENEEILELINYYETDEYKERQARSLLSLQKPGEFAVALPEVSASDDQSEQNSENNKSNLIKWWDYFFNQQVNE